MAPRTKERKAEAEPVSMDEARDALSHLVNRASYGGERIVIARNGTPIAAIIGLRDLEKLQSTAA